MPSVSPKQKKTMAAVAHGWQPPGRHIDVGVAKEFFKADQAAEKGKRTREQRADRKRSTSEWAEGKRKHP